MREKELIAEDLWPLVCKLPPEERMRLAQMALQSSSVSDEDQGRRGRYPLRGLPVEYMDPLEPVAPGDWESLQ